jgi:hypothetical protein
VAQRRECGGNLFIGRGGQVVGTFWGHFLGHRSGQSGRARKVVGTFCWDLLLGPFVGTAPFVGIACNRWLRLATVCARRGCVCPGNAAGVSQAREMSVWLVECQCGIHSHHHCHSGIMDHTDIPERMKHSDRPRPKATTALCDEPPHPSSCTPSACRSFPAATGGSRARYPSA